MGDRSVWRVAIVGGGISGLAAAERLASLDPSVEVQLFEASDKIGGVMQTVAHDGFCMELGPDSILSRLPWAVDLCRRIGFEPELVSTSSSPSNVHVVARGRLELIPPGLAIMAPQRVWPIVRSRILSWPGKARMALDWLLPRRKSHDDESLADFVRRRLGREALERLVQPLAGGVYMGDPERLSIQATFPQFVSMERNHGSLIRAARAGLKTSGNQKPTTGPQYSMFVAPRRGMGQLIDALGAYLVDCQIHLRHRVERVLRAADGRWQIDVLDESTNQPRTLDFDGVILALPARQVGRLLASVNNELSTLLAQIAYAGCIAVNLAYDQAALPRPLDSFGFVVPHIEGRPVLACTFSSVKYPGRAPAEKVLIRAYLGGACFPEVMDWSDERILQAVLAELRELLGVRGEPNFTNIARWPWTMPQYEVGHLSRVERIEKLVGELDRLELAGNAYRGVGIPHCIHSGAQASERLLNTMTGLCKSTP